MFFNTLLLRCSLRFLNRSRYLCFRFRIFNGCRYRFFCYRCNHLRYYRFLRYRHFQSFWYNWRGCNFNRGNYYRGHYYRGSRCCYCGNVWFLAKSYLFFISFLSAFLLYTFWYFNKVSFILCNFIALKFSLKRHVHVFAQLGCRL